MKTSELTGAALDWAVAKCENFYTDRFSIIRLWNNLVTKIIPGDYETREVYTSYSPSTDWAQGGPIIEREGITISREKECWAAYFRENLFNDDGSEHWQTGLTPLVAAMRCFVSFRLGDDIEIPSELIKGI